METVKSPETKEITVDSVIDETSKKMLETVGLEVHSEPTPLSPDNVKALVEDMSADPSDHLQLADERYKRAGVGVRPASRPENLVGVKEIYDRSNGINVAALWSDRMSEEAKGAPWASATAESKIGLGMKIGLNMLGEEVDSPVWQQAFENQKVEVYGSIHSGSPNQIVRRIELPKGEIIIITIHPTGGFKTIDSQVVVHMK